MASPTLSRRTLGRTGLSIGELSLGGLFTSSLGHGLAEARSVVGRALELGINLIDTAPGYGDSEEVLGKILRDLKTPVHLSTKLGGRPVPFDPQNTDQLFFSFDQSLKLLGRDTVDLLIIHEPDRPGQYCWWTDPEKVRGPVIDVLEALKKRGLIRWTGLGGTTSTELAHCMRSGYFDVVLTAFNYSPLYREAVNDIFPAAVEQRMGVFAGSVLHQGAFGRRHDALVKTRPAWLSRPRQQQILAFYDFLDRENLDIVDCSLRFALGNRQISTVLVGAKTAAQIEKSVASATRGPLSPAQIARLDEIAAMVPFRPFEEPMLLPFGKPYYGPGLANLGMGLQIGRDASRKT